MKFPSWSVSGAAAGHTLGTVTDWLRLSFVISEPHVATRAQPWTSMFVLDLTCFSIGELLLGLFRIRCWRMKLVVVRFTVRRISSLCPLERSHRHTATAQQHDPSELSSELHTLQIVSLQSTVSSADMARYRTQFFCSRLAVAKRLRCLEVPRKVAHLLKRGIPDLRTSADPENSLFLL